MQTAMAVEGIFADAIGAIQEAEFFGSEGAKVLDLRECEIAFPFLLQASAYLGEAVLVGPYITHSGRKIVFLLSASEEQIHAFMVAGIVPLEESGCDVDAGVAWGELHA